MKSVLIILFISTISNSICQENDNDCTCVPFYLCANGTINTNGEGIIDIRMKPIQQQCTSYLEICCKNKDLISVARSIRTNPAKQDCGLRNPDGIGFKITGDRDNEAQFGEFPWMIAIFNKSKYTLKHYYKCGGSLIHPQMVLTAAHCVDGVGHRFKIRAGEWDSQTLNELFDHQDRDVASVIIHPQYRRGNLQYDIALLFLKDPVKLSGHINRVCLPSQGKVASGFGCFVSGWGRTNFDPGLSYQAILKRIEVPIMPRVDCQIAFRRTRLGWAFQLHPTFMCAGGEEGVDSCTGDGGGPLVCPIHGQDDKFEQVGIVAWGIGCGTKGIPGAYVDVAYLRNWIDEQMKNKNLHTYDDTHDTSVITTY